jgi:TonB family protein
VFRPGPGIVAPLVATKSPPEYSEEARLAKLEGSVMLSLVIGADGAPRNLHLVRPLGLGLDERAMDNVRTWQFNPGTKNGTPVDVLVNEEVFFRPQRTLWDWHTIRAVFEPPAGASRPVLIQTKFPPTVAVEQNASVTIAFDVSARGVPLNPRVVKASDAKWEKELLGALREGWRFRPGAIDSQPCVVPAWFEFVRGSHSPIPPAQIPAR